MSLRELREQQKLRQVDVAKKLRVEQSTVSYWESGKHRPPRKYHKTLARLYGCSVDDIMMKTEESHERYHDL